MLTRKYCFPDSKMHRQIVSFGCDDATSAGDRGWSDRKRAPEGPWRGGHRGARACLQMETNGSS